MLDSPNEIFYAFKIQSQTPTETSSEFNGQCFSIKFSNKESIAQDEQPSLKKQQNKLKYRKLKQKLNNMGSTHDEKCVGVKQIGGPSKQKIMKLAIDFEKQVKMQNRDYYYMELYARELLKYVESRNQQELHLLRQSRMMPAIFQLLQKAPMLHKNQFNHVLKTLQICFKMIQIFTVLSINRDYLILTNRLNNLISLINWMVGKQEKKCRNLHFFNFQFLCFKVVNVLLNHRCKEQNAENVNSIINTTLQLILCSQIFKKVKYVACEQFVDQGQVQETELVQEMLKFLLIVLRKSHMKKDSIDSLISKDNQFSVYNSLKINPQLIKTIQFILPSFISYFIQIYESQQLDEYQDPTEMNLPNITINILNLTMKILNVCFQVSYVLFKKIFRDIEREPLFASLLHKLHRLIVYCKKEYEQEDANNGAKLLLNQIIVFVGYIGLEDPSVQKKIYETLIFQEISNLPIQFMMDPNLREIITPTICCLIYQNKTTLNFLMKDNSPLQIIKYLRKQIQTRPSLQRKNSTASLMSLAPNPIESGSFSYQLHRNQLSLRFPYVFWEDMCLELEKHA